MNKMNKTVFITGGSTGIGAATVTKFITTGWQVAFMDINVEAARKLQRRLASPNLVFIEGNTCNRADIRVAVETLIKRFGQLDCIVANASIHRFNTLLNIKDEELDLMIQTNIYGTINTLREAIPYLLRNEGGSIVINASDQCMISKTNSFAYGLTMGAVGQIARSLAIDLGPKKVRVNAVCAGTVHTSLADNLFRSFTESNHCYTDDYWQQDNTLNPVNHADEVSKIAEKIYFLASDVSGFSFGCLRNKDRVKVKAE